MSLLAGGLLVVLVSCGSGEQTSNATGADSAQPICDVYESIDWAASPVVATDSEEQVSTTFERYDSEERALVEASEGDMKDAARKVLAIGERYRERYLDERQAAGGGEALSARAAAAGFGSSRQFIESLAFDDPTVAERDRRVLSAQLAASCDDLAPLESTRLAPGEAPTGEILAAKLGTGEIHRFTPAGETFGPLELPAAVEAPIRFMTLSPDGQRLAFLAGTDPVTMWTVELDGGQAESTTAPTCMDWDDAGVGLYALVDTPPNEYVARISSDGTYDPGTRLELRDCPYRLTNVALVVPQAPVDGAPLQLDSVPKDGADPTPLATLTGCNLVSPRISPNGRQLLVTAGCRTDTASGVYLVTSEGTDLRQIVPGQAAAATWSPNGDWVAFGAYDQATPGDDDQTRILVTTPDGAQTGAVTPPGYSWPIWTGR